MKMSTREMARGAVIAAAYTALSMLSSLFGLTFGPIQLRLSEALTVLPKKYPCAIWGVFLGCLITNILSPYGLLDMIFGPLTTLVAALLTARCKHKWLAPLPPVLCNAVVIPALIAFQTVGFGAGFWAMYFYQAATIGAGQVLACYGLGMIMLSAMERVAPRIKRK